MAKVDIGSSAIQTRVAEVFHKSLRGVVVDLRAIEGFGIGVPGIEGDMPRHPLLRAYLQSIVGGCLVRSQREHRAKALIRAPRLNVVGSRSGTQSRVVGIRREWQVVAQRTYVRCLHAQTLRHLPLHGEVQLVRVRPVEVGGWPKDRATSHKAAVIRKWRSSWEVLVRIGERCATSVLIQVAVREVQANGKRFEV